MIAVSARPLIADRPLNTLFVSDHWYLSRYRKSALFAEDSHFHFRVLIFLINVDR